MAWCGASGASVLVDEATVHPHPLSRRVDPVTTVWPDIVAHHAWATENVYLGPKQLWDQAARYYLQEVEMKMPIIHFYG